MVSLDAAIECNRQIDKLSVWSVVVRYPSVGWPGSNVNRSQHQQFPGFEYQSQSGHVRRIHLIISFVEEENKHANNWCIRPSLKSNKYANRLMDWISRSFVQYLRTRAIHCAHRTMYYIPSRELCHSLQTIHDGMAIIAVVQSLQGFNPWMQAQLSSM